MPRLRESRFSGCFHIKRMYYNTQYQTQGGRSTDRRGSGRATGLGEAACLQSARTPWLPLHALLDGVLWPPREPLGFLGMLGAEAEGAGRQCRKAQFLSWTLQELGVGLRRGNFHMYRASLGLLAGVTGRGLRPGAAVPMEEVV
jgi:hypothetical protein